MSGGAILGFLVNPIAGMGGAVGLKGTDTPQILREAIARGARARAGERAVFALEIALRACREGVSVLAGARDMGEDLARRLGVRVEAVHGGPADATIGSDTERAAAEIARRGARLLLFAGGDGTARDICKALGGSLPVIGIPAGVKIHSAVYATTPRAAGELAGRFLDAGLPLRRLEVVDIDEDAYRGGALRARLFGYLPVPYHRDLVQGPKLGRVEGDGQALPAIAAEIAERMEPDRLYILGPGTTTQAIAQRFGAEKTLLGIDAVRNGRTVAADLGEARLLELVEGRPFSVIVTPIGGQGHIFGRGNQQIGPGVIRRLSRDQILVVASPEKLATLQGRPLRIDTGDPALDRDLAGYLRVITGYRSECVCPVRA